CKGTGAATPKQSGEYPRQPQGSLLTRRWRKADSDPWAPATCPTLSRPSLSPGSHSHSCLRDQLVHREGPAVRIRFPPPESLANLFERETFSAVVRPLAKRAGLPRRNESAAEASPRSQPVPFTLTKPRS